MRKLLDSSRIRAVGWRPRVDETTGLRNAYEDFLALLNAQVPGSRL
jgi:GDP-L-fucose synthase